MPNRFLDLLVRDLRWTDIARAHNIEVRSFPVDVWSVETFWSELAGVPDRRRYFAAITRDGDGRERLVGYGGLALGVPQCDIQTLVVAPTARGNGIGERLLVELLAAARARQCTVCHLEVRSDNEAAIALYEKHGFTPISRRPGYYGGEADAIVMTAVLDPSSAPATNALESAPSMGEQELSPSMGEQELSQSMGEQELSR